MQVATMAPYTRMKLNARLCLLVFTALSVSLPIAFVSLAKLLLFLTGLSLCSTIAAETVSGGRRHNTLLSTPVILSFIAVGAASLWFTGADQEEALIAFVKHGKLLIIPVLVYLVRTEREARYSVMAFVAGQAFVLLSSWLMALDIALPWISRPSGYGNILTQFVPYADSYLDQSIMLATTAGILWYLSKDEPWRWMRWLALGALLNVLTLMPGRTGYILAIATVCLIVFFQVPTRWRLPATLFVPVALALALFYSLPQFQQRTALAAQELNTYRQHSDRGTSIGARLNMWSLSMDAIRQSPITGHGIGNWTPVIKRLQGNDAEILFGAGNGSNPHQELLLWSVEFGSLGAVLFVALFIALMLDCKHFRQQQRRASLSVVVMLALACLFNSSLYDDLMGDYFCVAVGLLMALGLRDEPNTGKASVATT